MSIQTAIKKAIGDEKLSFLPMDESDPVERIMLISNEVKKLLAVSGAHSARISRLLADLQTFVKGEVISICFTPYKAEEAYLGRLDPVADGCWDVRSRIDPPSLRVLGHFVRPDCFVAIDWWPKFKNVPWSTKLPLLNDKARWASAIASCKADFGLILPGVYPENSMEVSRHVSEHYSLC